MVAFAAFLGNGDFLCIRGDPEQGFSKGYSGLWLGIPQPAWPAQASSPMDEFLLHLGDSYVHPAC